MNAVWTVFGYELKRNFLRKGYLFGTFGIPLLLLLGVLGYQVLSNPADTEIDPLAGFDFRGIQRAGVVDEAGVLTPIPRNLESVLLPYASEAEAREAMQMGFVDVFYVIDADYMATREVLLHLPRLALNLLTTQPVEQLVYETLAGDIDSTTIGRLRAGTTINQFNLQRNGDSARDEDADFLMIYAFTITFLLGVFFTNNYLLQSVVEEKENHIVEILLSSVSPSALLRGKVLAMSLLGLLQIAVFIVGLFLTLMLTQSLPAFETVTSLLNIRIPFEQLPIILLYFLLGYLFFAGFYAGIGAISNSMREAPQYAALLTLPAVLPFYFITAFMEAPNSTIPTVLSIIPVTAPIAMIMRLSMTTVPLIELAVSLGLLALSVWFAMWAAGRIFRVQTLLSGNAPRLRDIPRLLWG